MTNLLLTEREGRTGEYWPEVVAIRTERSEIRTKTTEGQYSPVRLEQARLVSSLLYDTRVMLVSKLPAFENKKYTSYDPFHGNGPYGKIPTKKEPIRTLGFTPRLPCHIRISRDSSLKRFKINFKSTSSPASRSCFFNLPNTKETETTKFLRISQLASIPFTILEDLEDESGSFEVLWIKLRPFRLPRGISSIIAGVVYHPPKAKNSMMLDYLTKCLMDLESKYPNCGLLVLGDFNHLNDARLKSNFNLKQIVHFPTRGQNTLDKILTNLQDYYDTPVERPAFGLSDHSSVEVQPKPRVKTSQTIQKVISRDLRPSNRLAMRTYLYEVDVTAMIAAMTGTGRFAPSPFRPRSFRPNLESFRPNLESFRPNLKSFRPNFKVGSYRVICNVFKLLGE